MPRFFNTAGPCDPERHYLLPPERRLPEARRLIDRQSYFILHAPRQSGKTTLVRTLAHRLTAEGRYTAVYATCEAAQSAGGDIEQGISALLDALASQAERLSPELGPRPLSDFQDTGAATRLGRYLAAWSERSPRPLLLFLDEIDSLQDDTLLSVLRQLRAGYPERPSHFPQSIVLIGLRDVRDYRIRIRQESGTLGTSSPFNVKVRSLTLANFTRDEVTELYRQHTAETGQAFTSEAIDLAWELTRGQPWLVNALAAEVVDALVPERAMSVEPRHIERAKEILIERRDTHLDSLIDRLREPRVRRVIEPILVGNFFPPDLLDDDVQYVKDLGLVAAGPQGLDMANPIYREVIPRALSWVLQETLPIARAPFIAPDGSLRIDKILADFRSFWCQNAEFFLDRQPYSEAAAQLVFMAYLQRVVNGGGLIDREYGVGSGRIDLCIRWPSAVGFQRWAIELKVWRDGRPDPLQEGLAQLSGYLARLALENGTLIVFDTRTSTPPLPERCTDEEVEHAGHHIRVIRL
jgi:type II secretory pathway predicted ATPase ExeA